MGYLLIISTPDLSVLSVNWAEYSEQWGFDSSPGTLIWHAKVKDARRLSYLQAWKHRHHCDLNATLDCSRKARGRSCAGGTWWRCDPGGSAATKDCEDRKISLKSIFFGRNKTWSALQTKLYNVEQFIPAMPKKPQSGKSGRRRS